MKEHVAENLNALMLEFSSRLNQSVETVKNSSDTQEFNSYRKSVGNILGQIYCDILTPIYNQYPNLIPAELKTKIS